MRIKVITIQDCIEMHENEGQEVVINDGEIKGFIIKGKEVVVEAERR